MGGAPLGAGKEGAACEEGLRSLPQKICQPACQEYGDAGFALAVLFGELFVMEMEMGINDVDGLEEGWGEIRCGSVS